MKTIYTTLVAIVLAVATPAFANMTEEEKEANCQEWYGMSCGEYAKSRTAAVGVRG